jgi:ParB-like chromosome segregation protein Spo0J
MKIEHISIDKLVLKSGKYENARHTPVPKTRVNELADSIAYHGLMKPIEVKLDSEGNDIFPIIDGGTRVQAIRNLIKEGRANGYEKGVPCFVDRKIDDIEAMAKSMSANQHTTPNTSFDIAKQMTMLETEGLQRQEIAVKVGKSKAWVSRILNSYQRATSEVKEAWRTQKLTNEQVQGITKESSQEQDKTLRKVLEHTAKENVTLKDRSEARKLSGGGKKKSEKKESAKRPSAAQLQRYLDHCKNSGIKSKFLQGFQQALEFALGELGPGELDLELSGADPKNPATPISDRKPKKKAPAAKKPAKKKTTKKKTPRAKK